MCVKFRSPSLPSSFILFPIFFCVFLEQGKEGGGKSLRKSLVKFCSLTFLLNVCSVFPAVCYARFQLSLISLRKVQVQVCVLKGRLEEIPLSKSRHSKNCGGDFYFLFRQCKGKNSEGSSQHSGGTSEESFQRGLHRLMETIFYWIKSLQLTIRVKKREPLPRPVCAQLVQINVGTSHKRFYLVY